MGVARKARQKPCSTLYQLGRVSVDWNDDLDEVIKIDSLLERGYLARELSIMVSYIHGKVQLYNISSPLSTLIHEHISTILVNSSRTSFLFPVLVAVIAVPHQQSQDPPNTSHSLDSIFCDEEIEPFGALEVEAAP